MLGPSEPLGWQIGRGIARTAAAQDVHRVFQMLPDSRDDVQRRDARNRADPSS